MKRVTSILFLFVLCVPWHSIRSQGCSDAGFCTLNALRNSEDAEQHSNNTFRLGSSYGMTYNHVNVVQSFGEYSYNLNERVEGTIKITHALTSGELGSTNGLADIYLSGRVSAWKNVDVIGGVKIPLNNGNRHSNGLPLPMNYQTSLGTYDGIVGLSYLHGKTRFNAALQYPFTGNSNTFLLTDYPEGSAGRNYLSTNEFVRSPDVMLRVTRQADFNKRLKLVYGVLPVFHLANDRFTNSDGDHQSIQGSKGLTLNINAVLFYSLMDHKALEFTFGAPVMARKKRPDGLSQFAMGIAYRLGW